MKILVTAASKHGATAEIAQAIGDVLTASGIDTEIRPPDEVSTVAPYDGVVLGSAVYAGRWLGPAKELVARESAALRSKPVWLFSSGPVGDPPAPEAEPPEVEGLREQTHAIDHHVFAGRLERKGLGLGEKAIVAVVRAPNGDFRRWDEVTAWASAIAVTLRANVSGAAVP